MNVKPVKINLARNRLVRSLLLQKAECFNKTLYSSNEKKGKTDDKKEIRTQTSSAPRLCLGCSREFSFGLPLW